MRRAENHRLVKLDAHDFFLRTRAVPPGGRSTWRESSSRQPARAEPASRCSQSAKLKRAATPRRTIGLLGTFRVRMGSARAQSVPKRFQKERAGQAADERMNTTRAVSLLRTGGAFLLNFAVATVGVAILESPFIRYVHFFP